MKKIIVTLLAVSLAVSAFAGCTSNSQSSSNVASQPSQSAAELKYKDGTYRAEAADFHYGWKDYVVLTIKNDQITIDEFDAYSEQDNTKLKSKDEDYKTSMMAGNAKNGLPETYPAKYSPELIASFGKTGDVEQVENVAGATSASNTFKRFIREILGKNALTGDTTTLVVNKYADGEYKVMSADYHYGWKDFVVAEVKDGVLTVKQYDAINQEDPTKLKSQDEEYKTNMIAGNKKNNLPETYPEKYSAELVAAFTAADGDLSKVETVAGATTATESFKKLMTAVLKNAENGVTGEYTLPQYVDGTYRAEMSTFSHGWKDYVVLTVKDGKVTIDEYDSFNETDNTKLKSKDADYKESMSAGNKKNGMPETYPEKYSKELVDSFNNANGDVTKVENVAGATSSSNNFKLLVGQLLKSNAATGDTTTLVVEPAAE